MTTKSKLGLGAALLILIAGCGAETPSGANRASAIEQNVDNGMIVDPEVPNAAGTNVAATDAPAAERPAARSAPVPPAAPKAPPTAKAEAPKAKVDVPRAAAEAEPKPEPSPPPKTECAPEHRAAGHC